MSGTRIAAASLSGLLAVLVLVAAGCGNSDKKANQAYANSVCSAVAAWEQQVKTIATTFTGPISKTTLDAKIAQVKTETKKLVSQIKAVPPPNTSDGKAAKQQLDQLSTQVNTTITNAQSAVSQIPANASALEVASALVPLAPQVQSLATSAQTTLKSLQSAKGSLASAFKSTSSCKNLSG
jgi:hypothetical protein